jgi:hypothetical protein
MPDNLIRAIIVLALPLFFPFAIIVGVCHALRDACEELGQAWRDPQSTRFTDWSFWK